MDLKAPSYSLQELSLKTTTVLWQDRHLREVGRVGARPGPHFTQQLTGPPGEPHGQQRVCTQEEGVFGGGN